jgi:PAS domain S-box-containing protein
MRILLIEDNPGDIRLLQEYLKEGSACRFQIVQADRLSIGLERLAEAPFDAVLLDLSLPDSQGLDTLVRLHEAAKDVPIVVLTGIEDEALGVRLIQAGAQDYLVKGYVTGPLLVRSLRYAAERKRAEEELYESEARLRAILDNSPNLVFLKDPQGRYLHINREFERAFHISREAIVGKTDREVFPAEQAAVFRTNDIKVLQAGVPLQFEEVSVQDNGPHTSLVSKFPLYGGDGKLYALCGITTDITQRKAMEKALQLAEEKYHSIFDRAVEGIFQSTPSGHYLSVNPALARMYGYASPEELMRSVTDIAHQVYVDPDCRVALTQLLELRGVVRGFEYEVYRKDGSAIWISESVRAVRSEQGEILYYEGTIEDITDRRRAEEERRRLAAMIESSNDAIMSLTEGRISFWNPAAEKLFGYSSEEIFGQSADILEPSHLRGKVERIVERILRGELIQDYETERVRKNGSIVPVSLAWSTLKDATGKIIGLFAIIRDITERKRVEDELRRSLEYLELAQSGAEAGLWDWDIGSNKVTWSKQLYHLYGVSPATIPSYENWLASVYEEDRQRADLRVREAVKQCSDLNHDFRVNHPERGLRWLVAIGRTICDNKGAALRMTGFVFDITERKRAEEELQRTLGQVRMLSRRLEVVREDERTRIARELHDELGVRLTCLKMDLSRLQPIMNDASRPKLEEKVLSMIEQVDTTIAAVQGLVAELRPGVLDDLGLVAAIEWQCRDFERRSGIRCFVDSSEEDIPLDSARTTAAFRICQEALTNVVRHARAKEIRVHLAKLDRELLLEIHDDGQGIVPEKFIAATSLGLLGMRERAGAVGGTLQIIGQPGQGTTVTLRLPCE